MILGHHGWGEELVLYAAAGGTAALPAVVHLWRARLGRLAAWLHRR